MSKVIVKEGKDRYRTTYDAISEVQLCNYINNKPILIKPNFINETHADMGMTTDVNVVKAIVDYLSKLLPNEIIIAEGNGCGSVMKGYTNNGYDKLGVKLVNLGDTEMITYNLIGNENIYFSSYAFHYQVISVAKLKPHTLAGATLTMKNLMGFVYPKGNMHQNLHQKIVNLHRSVKPVFGVIDGFVANAISEQENAPIPMDCVITGNNLVDVDIVGSKIMGIDYVGHLEIAKREGLSTNDLLVLGDIDLLSNKYNRLKANGN
jgi:uncharacterized protein (DUF362 family)